jgi:hypothetical protein
MSAAAVHTPNKLLAQKKRKKEGAVPKREVQVREQRWLQATLSWLLL